MTKTEYIEAITRHLLVEDVDFAAEVRAAKGPSSVYSGTSDRIRRLVRLAWHVGVRRGAGLAWEAGQPLDLRVNLAEQPTTSGQADLLRVDFFASNFEPDGLRRLSNAMVTATKDHPCHGNGRPCTRGIATGERHRRMIEASDELGLVEYRWCFRCLCEAAAEGL